MKKKLLTIILAIIVLLAILFIPIPQGSYDDGGTKEYTALTYKIVDWNRITADGIYEKTRLYFGKDRSSSIEELWEQECENLEHLFLATIVDLNDDVALVEPLPEEDERRSSDRISLNISSLQSIPAEVGTIVQITYTGGIMESYPAQIHATKWEIATDLRQVEYTDQWIQKTEDLKYENDIFSDIIISKIYSNCFFAYCVIPMPYEIKLNGTLSEEWCVGDQVAVTYENTYYNQDTRRVEADLIEIKVSEFELEEGMCYKPVIYLYPEEKTQVDVKLNLNGGLTCTYPAYQDGWQVTAFPDGTLLDEQGQSYNYLYWEGITDARYDFSRGFCVKGEDTAAFLDNALAQLGLTRRESNEFIVYWLPLMQENPYNIISFQTDAYTQAAKLQVSPAPDTQIRVFMVWKASDKFVEITAQTFTAPQRQGFTVVEWGGTEIE